VGVGDLFSSVAGSAKKKAALTPGDMVVNIEPDRGKADGVSRIQGSVTDPSGAGVSGALVTVHPFDSAPTITTQTIASGAFLLDGIPAGRYRLLIASPGFERATIEIEVKGRDLATVASMLAVGSATQTVAVSAAATNTQTEKKDTSSTREPLALPSKLPVASMVSRDPQLLALDTAGTLFFSKNEGRHWKIVRAVWPGRAAQLGVAVEEVPVGVSSALRANSMAKQHSLATAPVRLSVFRLTTEGGETWISLDGFHWTPEPAQH
jgi:Carboxypeptidase regulatory-like domain